LSKKNIAAFARLVRARSRENREAVALLRPTGHAGISVAILRLELDSLIRVLYLLSQGARQRDRLIEASLHGQRWRHPDGKTITDAQMVRHSATLHGWAGSVYSFGCAFIHLSRNHDYLTLDPFAALPLAERETISSYVRFYHGGAIHPNSEFAELVAYIPAVFEKISSNLEAHLRDLKEGRKLGA